MKKVTTILALCLSVMFLNVQFAAACDKHGKEQTCAFKSDKLTMSLADKEGGGFLVDFVIKGTPEEIKALSAKLSAKVKGCKEGACKCAGAADCPFSLGCMTYTVTENDKGFQVAVTGGCKGKQAQFKKKMETFIANKGCGGGCKGDGSCKGDGGCKGDGSCGCKGGDKKPEANQGGCGCGHK